MRCVGVGVGGLFERNVQRRENSAIYTDASFCYLRDLPLKLFAYTYFFSNGKQPVVNFRKNGGKTKTKERDGDGDGDGDDDGDGDSYQRPSREHHASEK